MTYILSGASVEDFTGVRSFYSLAIGPTCWKNVKASKSNISSTSRQNFAKFSTIVVLVQASISPAPKLEVLGAPKLEVLGAPKLDFTEARDSEWQWHQLGHMQVAPDR